MLARAALSALLLPLAAAGCASTRPRDLVAEVKVAAREFDDAQLRGDRSVLERYLAVDFLFVRGSGAVSGRADFIAAFTKPGQKLDPFVITNPVFARLGDGAVLVGGDAVLSGVDGGSRFSERIRYADIFAWRDGRWQVVYTQVTRLE